MPEYRYGMRLRGYSPGAQPKGVLRREDDPTGVYYDVLVYERPLTHDEITAYELDAINPVKDLRSRTKLSQAKFAEEYHIPRRTVENWESGVREPPEYVLRLLERAVNEDFPE